MGENYANDSGDSAERRRRATRSVVVSTVPEDMPEEFRVRPEDCGGFRLDIVTRARVHWLPGPEFPALHVVGADVAAGQCLHSIMNGTHGWDVPEVPGLSARQVRAIQFIDAIYQCTWLSADGIRRGARHYVDRRTLDRLLALADAGVQSPRETLLRLYARASLPAGHVWTSQVMVLLDPKGRP